MYINFIEKYTSFRFCDPEIDTAVDSSDSRHYFIDGILVDISGDDGISSEDTFIFSFDAVLVDFQVFIVTMFCLLWFGDCSVSTLQPS